MNFKSLPTLLEYFKDEKTCIEYFEKQRWNGTIACPHCGNAEKIYRTNRGYKCGAKECHKKFTVKVGTIFEDSKISLKIWFAAIYLCSSSKKGISSLQLGRQLDITQKTAWFVLHRVRKMLKEEEPTMLEGTIEADETYVGGKESNKHASTRSKRLVNGKIPKFGGDKTMVFGLVQRDGKVINQVIPKTEAEYILPIIQKNVKKGSHITTDSLALYQNVVYSGFTHSSVNHFKKEYVRGNSHTGTIDGYWALLKRGIIGIYHSTSKKHLHRYCNEFSYRYNSRKVTDIQRFDTILTHVEGRLTYKALIGK